MTVTAVVPLVEFLTARLDDDEERARFVQWQAEHQGTPFEPWRLSWHDEYDLLCIEPSRALREVEAKRRIIDRHAPSIAADMTVCVYCDWSPEYPCSDVRDMGRIYSDHPDWREEWCD